MGHGCLARFHALLSGGDDPNPDAFAFADQFAVAPGGTVTSVDNVTPDSMAVFEPIVVMGVTVSVPVSVVGAEWTTDGVNFRSGPGVVSNLTPIALRRRTGPAGTTVSATLIVGDQSDDWVLRQPQLGDTTPDAFSFTTVTNATPLTNVVSNDITITGVGVPVWVSAPNAHFLDPVSGLYVGSGYLSIGATTHLRVLTSRFAGASYFASLRIGTVEATFEVRNAGGDSCSVDIGGVSDQFRVTTASAPSGGRGCARSRSRNHAVTDQRREERAIPPTISANATP